MINHAFLSHVGRVRIENQDFYGCWPEMRTFALADGMGGHNDGALASRLAIEAIERQIRIDNKDLKESIIQAHIHIIKTGNERNLTNMGTTGVVVHIDEDRRLCHLAWCGDSRAYRYNSKEKQLIQISKDHSLVQELIDIGEITEDEALTDKRRNIITNAIGIGGVDRIKVDFKKIQLNPDDCILICSDGLSNEVCDYDIEQAFKVNTDPSIICEHLMDMSLNNGAKDNTTIGIIKLC